MKKISIIVPVYNVEGRLRNCLDSISAQSYTNFEAILIDDASTDGSGAICEEYAGKDARFRVFHQTNNQGVSAARNRGLEEASGEYITFCDSDDCILPFYLESIMVADADLVVTGVKNLYPDGSVAQNLQYQEEFIQKVTSYTITRMIADKSICYVYSKRYCLQIIRQNDIKFDISLSLGEDTLFVADYLCTCSTIYVSKESSYLYYQNTSGSLSSFNSNYVEKLITANKKILYSLEQKFSGIKCSHEWNARIWSVFYYSIFEIIKSNVPYLKKYRQLKYIFNHKIFCSMVREKHIWMEHDSKLVQNIIGTRSPFIVLSIFFLLSLRKSSSI